MSTANDRLPAQLKSGLIIAVIESLIAFGFAVWLIAGDLIGRVNSSVVSESAASQWIGLGTGMFIFVLFGTVLGGAISLFSGRSWGRTPVAMMQIMLIPVAWYLASEGRVVPGIFLFVVALSCLVLLLHPHSNRYVAEHYNL